MPQSGAERVRARIRPILYGNSVPGIRREDEALLKGRLMYIDILRGLGTYFGSSTTKAAKEGSASHSSSSSPGDLLGAAGSGGVGCTEIETLVQGNTKQEDVEPTGICKCGESGQSVL